MKRFKNAIISLCIIILISGLVACDDGHVKKGQNELAYFLATYSPQPYDGACDKPNGSTPLSLNSPVTLGTFSQKYNLNTGTSGLKYSLTLSPDYPNCGVTLYIYTCSKPNTYASDTNVSCNQGTFSTHVSGGSQTCTIPAFSNQLVLILIQPNSVQYPSTKCATITFEALP
ncbi:hypothetical protein [Leptospira santarosai]|uniref:hypothetical protein n=1 Tax=Leptospira santarosai TaxID=28183 RepID=UPI000361F862|nr:hypothetical protein [Leptospira santarosai]